MTASIQIEGLRELSNKISSMNKKVRDSISKKAASEGVKVLKSEAQARVPVKTGLLKRDIVIRKFRSKREGYVRYAVGLVSAKAVYKDNKTNRRLGRVGETYYKDDRFYGSFIEFGTRKMKARPFLRPAFEAKKEEATRVTLETLKQELDKYD